jgi:hypothetical protein
MGVKVSTGGVDGTMLAGEEPKTCGSNVAALDEE